MKTLNFFFISLALTLSFFTHAQTIVINIDDKAAMQEFLAETTINFEAEWTNMIASMEAEMNSIGLLEKNNTFCCPSSVPNNASFNFMGESFPEVTPTLETMVDAIDTPLTQNGIEFLGEQFPELPTENMTITEQRNGDFYFMNEWFPPMPEDQTKTPLL